MRISVFGIGYVGAVSAACLAADGHDVVAVDTNPQKVKMINDGVAPIVEAGLAELVREGARSGRLRATSSADEAVMASACSLICVGTPSHGNGNLDLTQVERVCESIGAVIALFLRARDDVAQLVGFIGCDREARLFLLKLGKALEFLIGQKFRHGFRMRGRRAPAVCEQGRRTGFLKQYGRLRNRTW